MHQIINMKCHNFNVLFLRKCLKGIIFYCNLYFVVVNIHYIYYLYSLVMSGMIVFVCT